MADEVTRQVTATLAGQVATFTPKVMTTGHPDHLVITAATVTFSANAASFINTLDEYEIQIQRRTKT
jgi:hypothetical protein